MAFPRIAAPGSRVSKMGYSEVNPETKAKIKGLTLTYQDRPQPGLLITVPNPHEDLVYEERLTYPEFTCLCPLATAQPDYATVNIIYLPKKKVIELKSLKFYLVSYRQVEILHEDACGKILKDLVDCCQPSWTFTHLG